MPIVVYETYSFGRCFAFLSVAFLLVLLADAASAKEDALILGAQASSACTFPVGGSNFYASAPNQSVLVGLRVRSGAYVDGLGPIFAHVDSSNKLGAISALPLHGGGGGSLQPDLVRDGYVVVGINRRLGTALDAVQLIWRKWDHGTASGPEVQSPWVGGSGGTLQAPWTAPDGFVATDLTGSVTTYTDGNTYLSDVCLTTFKAGTDTNGSPTSTSVLFAAVSLAVICGVLALVLWKGQVTEQQFFIVRVVMSLCGAAFAAIVPGFLNVDLPAVKAGGALAVFVILYRVAPGETQRQSGDRPPSPQQRETSAVGGPQTADRKVTGSSEGGTDHRA